MLAAPLLGFRGQVATTQRRTRTPVLHFKADWLLRVYGCWRDLQQPGRVEGDLQPASRGRHASSVQARACTGTAEHTSKETISSYHTT